MIVSTYQLVSLTAQDIFDVVAWNMLRQRVKGLGASGGCAYRGLHGTRCALGWVLPDDLYEPSMEGRGISELACDLLHEGGDATRFARFALRHLTLLRELQFLHDTQRPDTWPDRLLFIGRRHGLNPSVVDHVMRARRSSSAKAQVPALFTTYMEALVKHVSKEREEACEVQPA